MNNKIYEKLAVVPEGALKTIEAGKLKGKYDINPQWKIEALTEAFGLCGIGWKFEIKSANQIPLQDGQLLLFMEVNLYVQNSATGQWSEAIPGMGGDFIVQKTKNGLVANDEAYKMCLTDALGNAAKCIGVAANVYRGLMDSKYTRKPVNNQVLASEKQLADLKLLAKQKAVSIETICKVCNIPALEGIDINTYNGIMKKLNNTKDPSAKV